MRWASRRGLLELDLFLEDFVAKAYPVLGEDMKALYKELMGEADQDLFEWLMGRSQPSDTLRPIVEIIRAHKKAEGRL
jgi:antitoxin CptB